jgi:hypothetical protein
MTGAIIGLSVGQPVLAIIVALLSHFALDAIPHFGFDEPETKLYKSVKFKAYLITEALICFVLVATLASAQPNNWMLAAICAFVAAAPDLLSINHFRKVQDDEVWKPSLYSRFAGGIQWFEHRIGGLVEAAWAVGCLVILAKLV